MRLIVTGHREEKLNSYDIVWIMITLNSEVQQLNVDRGISLAYSGMASGVDLWFCESCFKYKIPYIACIPFDEQSEYMTDETKSHRETLLKYAKEKMAVKNSWMVEHCDYAIVVWDGNKGGTHNVLQQLIEKQIPFTWINPVAKKVWRCE
jgi:uncharacterized phage-like protein YoqJ